MPLHQEPQAGGIAMNWCLRCRHFYTNRCPGTPKGICTRFNGELP